MGRLCEMSSIHSFMHGVSAEGAVGTVGQGSCPAGSESTLRTVPCEECSEERRPHFRLENRVARARGTEEAPWEASNSML